MKPFDYNKYKKNNPLLKEVKLRIGDDGYGKAEIEVEKTKSGFRLTDKSKYGWPSVDIPTKDVQKLIAFLQR